MRNKMRVVGGCFFTVLLLAALFLMAQVIRIGMIPLKFLIPAVILIAAVVGILAIFLLAQEGKYQDKSGNAGRIVCMFLAGILAAAFTFAGVVVGRIKDTVSSVTEPERISTTVDVYVLAEDPAVTLEDTGKYTWGVMGEHDYDRENTEQALSIVQERIHYRPESISYISSAQMADALYKGEVKAILLNSAYVDFLTGLEGYEDFLSRVRSVDSISVLEEPASETTAPSAETQVTEETGPEKKDETLVVYLSGSDTRSKKLTSGRSDVNILAVVNTKSKEVLLLNTPRDYYVPNHKLGDRMDKLAHCGNQGAENSIYALNSLYNVEIPYYAQINFTGFETLIDALGGITIESDISFTTTYGKLHITKGINYLNGKDALEYARERQVFATGDIARGNHQMQVISAVIDKITSGSTVLNHYFDIMESLEGMFRTNVPEEKISGLVRMQLDDMAQWNVHSYSVTGQGASKITAQAGDLRLYVMLPDQSMISHGQNLIQKVMNGEHLTDEDVK